MNGPSWLESEINPANGEGKMFSLDKARQFHEVRDLIPGKAWLVLSHGTSWVKFAVLEFSMSNTDGSNAFASSVFFGEGPTGYLRECRHTYWGKDGYVFYPSGPIILAAFKALSEFFDDMVTA